MTEQKPIEEMTIAEITAVVAQVTTEVRLTSSTTSFGAVCGMVVNRLQERWKDKGVEVSLTSTHIKGAQFMVAEITSHTTRFRILVPIPTA